MGIQSLTQESYIGVVVRPFIQCLLSQGKMIVVSTSKKSFTIPFASSLNLIINVCSSPMHVAIWGVEPYGRHELHIA